MNELYTFPLPDPLLQSSANPPSSPLPPPRPHLISRFCLLRFVLKSLQPLRPRPSLRSTSCAQRKTTVQVSSRVRSREYKKSATEGAGAARICLEPPAKSLRQQGTKACTGVPRFSPPLFRCSGLA